MFGTKELSSEDFTAEQQALYVSGIESIDIFNRRNPRTISISFRYNFGTLEDDKTKSRRKSFEGEGRGGGQMDMGF